MLKINAERLLKDMDDLAAIGATPEGGVSRPALSTEDIAARNWFKQRIVEAGLIYAEDSAGNQSGILQASPPTTKRLVAGSHLDSVPDGGRFDGALGTLAALEAVRTIQEAGITLPVSLEAISFTDEEGTLLGLMGSRAAAGQLTHADFENPRGGKQILTDGLARANLTESGFLNAKRDDILAFVELHIEQGQRLEESKTDIGVVTNIVGIASTTLKFVGKANHAGTTPMDKRADALWGASAFVQRAKNHIIITHTPGVVNFGIIQAKPGAFNIVPGEVELAMEYRHGTAEHMAQMAADLFKLAEDTAAEYGLTLETQSTPPIQPAPMDNRIVQAIESAASSLRLSHTRLLSFAGHDTQSISKIAPAAMLFVPSVNGISHNPAEYTKPSDVVNGANVVLHTLLNLMQTWGPIHS